MFEITGENFGWYLGLALPPLLVAAMVLFNLVVWPRGRPGARLPGRVSVLVPARNEARNIVRCLRAVLAGDQRPYEVIVYDDGSTDGTYDVVAQVAEMDPVVRVVRGGELPPGWVGKPYACHRLAEAATGEVLVYLDADTFATPTLLARIGSVMETYRADVVSAAPRQVMVSLMEQIVIPLLHLSYLAWLPLPLVWRTRDPRFLVANGQVLALRRDALERAGGWEAVRADVVDDMAICRRVKASGGRVVFADGHQMATCRMYEGRVQVWHGFSKNLYEGLGGRPLILLFVILLYAGVFVAPYVALYFAMTGRGYLAGAATLGVLANVAIRAAMAARLRHPSNGVIVHPVSALWFVAIAVNSFRWSRSGRIAWRGRVYPAR
ncbi:MAG TPA: glycosyltransferase family 2 protein, partial [Longimicrobium sp.]|nr:glycosyltransferase family 2 protein [Longimicrobium sp.]